jgi:hypothetical protein
MPALARVEVRSPSSHLPRVLAAFTPLAVFLALAPSAFATHFTLVIANTDGTRPAALTAGQETTVKATIGNQDPWRPIGSANLTAPSGLQVVSATPGTTGGTATVAGNVVQLRNISIPKGTSRDLTIRLRAPTSAALATCLPKDYTWPTPAAKQQGNFSGTTFVFRSSGSDRRTRVTPTCALRFARQPADADPGATITGTPYEPLAPGVAVEIVDAAGTRVPVSGVPVGVAIGANPGSGTLSGTQSAPSVAGLVTYDNLSIDNRGVGYTLVATSSGISSATSTPFRVERSAFSLRVSGPGGGAASVPTGAQAPLELTLTNTAGGRTLGSADIPLPAGLTVVGTTPPGSTTATVDGAVLEVRNLGLAPGASLTIPITVSTPCATAGTSLTWPAPTGRPAADFSGLVTFDFDVGASALGTEVSGACTLEFLTAPADAGAGTPITGTPYNVNGLPVMVRLLAADGQPATGSGTTISVALGAGGGPGTLSGTASSGTTSGVANFADLSIDLRGTYTLVATSSDAMPVTSDPFDIETVGVACDEDVTCSGTVQLSNNAKVSVAAVEGPNSDTDTGTLTVGAGVGGQLDCNFYTEVGGALDVIAVDFTNPDRRKTVTATFPGYTGNVSALQVCFGAPYKFATRLLTSLTVNVDYVPGPYPAPEYKGLLPTCGALANRDDPSTWWIIESTLVLNAGPPCVQSRTRLPNGDAVITSIWPSGNDVGSNLDPRGRF